MCLISFPLFIESKSKIYMRYIFSPGFTNRTARPGPRSTRVYGCKKKKKKKNRGIKIQKKIIINKTSVMIILKATVSLILHILKHPVLLYTYKVRIVYLRV